MLTLLLASCAAETLDAPPATSAPASATEPAPPLATALPEANAPATLEPTPTDIVAAPPMPQPFDGDLAMTHLVAQVEFGPRYPGSEGHVKVRDYMVDQLEAVGWAAERQTFDYKGFEGMNIIGRANLGQGPIVIIGAHYDTRRVSEQSFGQEDQPGVGAVDGASGVAVLLELARTLDLSAIDNEVWLAFFDFEDNGNRGIEDWDWIVGSTYMASTVPDDVEAMVLVDMIGDADQQLYYEGNSSPNLREAIWGIADELGFGEQFIPEVKYTIIDDHIPFLQRGITSIDIIDFDYPYWHTVEDTVDKTSAESLYRVGRTVQVWLETK